ncbi:hypothetical protein [Colwellia sp. MB02u-14]|uniref:hypothetical protein n=1 Tax=Colwellia sp. MB02u-14 TaxID=2759815 RepID=UPI0015F75D34|nr:hypothetical protein [Colwellia sp. MB02u-14]MBA6302344.1 hypothetical protein [Colwellia sp. MB02u-14]
MKYIFAIFIFVFSINYCSAEASEEQKIRAVIKVFEESIQNKDRELFLGLFLEKGVSWVGVFSEKIMVKRTALIEKINKDDNKNFSVTREFTTSPKEFIDQIISVDAEPREEFSNIKIYTDGNIAAFYFDYIFYSDDKEEIWGSGSWQLVQTIKGWKIQSVSYSINND